MTPSAVYTTTPSGIMLGVQEVIGFYYPLGPGISGINFPWIVSAIIFLGILYMISKLFYQFKFRK